MYALLCGPDQALEAYEHRLVHSVLPVAPDTGANLSELALFLLFAGVVIWLLTHWHVGSLTQKHTMPILLGKTKGISVAVEEEIEVSAGVFRGRHPR
jgi:hypothetical protein